MLSTERRAGLFLLSFLAISLTNASRSANEGIGWSKKESKEGDTLLYRRSNTPIAGWNAPPTYESYQPPAFNVPDSYGHDVYQPPPIPRQGFPPELYGVFPPSIDEEVEGGEEEEDDSKRKHRKGKKSHGRLRNRQRRLDEAGNSGAEAPPAEYGYDTNGPGSPMVCGPAADATYGAYGGGHSTDPRFQGNGYNPPTPAGYKQPVNTDPGADFSKAKPCGPGDGYGSDWLNDDNGGTLDDGNTSQTGTGVLGTSTNSNASRRAQKEGHKLPMGPIVGGLATMSLVVGGAYIGHRHYKNKKKQQEDSTDGNQYDSYDHSKEYDVEYQGHEGQTQHYEREGVEEYHDAEMYGYGHGHDYHHK